MEKFDCPYTKGSYPLHHHQGYEFLSPLPTNQAKALLDALLQKNYSINKVYKDNKSCFVANVDTDTHSSIMFKIPRERNNRGWERFLTLFRPNEAFRTYSSMITVLSIGLNAPQPLIAVHRKDKGMSAESFFVYEFIKGVPGTKKDASVIYKALRSLHQAGFTRSDPKLVNFIVDEDKVSFIDFRLKQPKIFANFQCTLNLCRFLHLGVSREFSEFGEFARGIPFISLAHHLLVMKKKIRKFRRGLRDILSRKKK